MLRFILLLGGFAFLVVACGVVTQGWGEDPPKFVAGNVYDALTKQPMEGVFILGSYKQCGGGIVLGHAGSNCPCSQTVGIRTAKDGGFQLPLSASGGVPAISAFAENRYVKSTEWPKVPSDASRREKAQSLKGWQIWLAPQDPASVYPVYSAEGDACTEVYGDAVRSAAGNEFKSLIEAEKLRLSRDSGVAK